MFKKGLSAFLVCVVITSIFMSSFSVSADDLDINDFLTVHPGDVPPLIDSDDVSLYDVVPEDDNLDLNAEYYNSEHFAAGEEDTTIFNEKQEFNTESDLLDNNDSLVVNDNFGSDPALTADDGIALYSDDEAVETRQPIPQQLKIWSKFHNRHLVIPASYAPYLVCDMLGTTKVGAFCDVDRDKDYSGYYNYVFNSSYKDNFPTFESVVNSGLLSVDNLFIFSYNTKAHGIKYGFIFTDSDRIDLISYDNSLGGKNYTFDSSSSAFYKNSNYLSAFCYGGFDDGDFSFRYSLEHVSCSINGISGIGASFAVPGGSGSFYYDGVSTNLVSVYIGKNLNVYFDDVKQDHFDDSGLLVSDIKGDITYNKKANVLNFKAYCSSSIDKKYDIHLFALDSTSCPPKINNDLSYSYVDLNNYDNLDLQITPTKKEVNGSINLEQAYYYIQKMSGYDDSLDSVNGYDHSDFVGRENVMFALAFRVVGTSDDWTVCKYYLFNYYDFINNIMGSFTVRKDYIDFPSLSDFTEKFPSISDFLPEDTGLFEWDDWILAFIKWIGNCVYILGKNFIGFFEWIGACIPVCWQNLKIALYNLVCDIKELAIYLFKPKTNSIANMAKERLPGVDKFISACKTSRRAELPSITLFGATFSLDPSDYDIDVSALKSFSQILIMIMFAVGTYNLAAHIFGFVKLSGIFDAPTDPDGL